MSCIKRVRSNSLFSTEYAIHLCDKNLQQHACNTRPKTVETENLIRWYIWNSVKMMQTCRSNEWN